MRLNPYIYLQMTYDVMYPSGKRRSRFHTLSAIMLLLLFTFLLTVNLTVVNAELGTIKPSQVEKGGETPDKGEEAQKKGEEILSKSQEQLKKAEKTFENIQKGGGSGCLIATAAFGSELTPQVQFLRNFRDKQIMSTSAGSSFMNVFNAWYYSFSPYVANYEREQVWFQNIVKTAIYPLIGILQISETGYSSMQGEYGAVTAGLIASSMIGALYFWPFALSFKQVRISRFGYKLAGSIIIIAFVGAIGSIVTGNEFAMMISTPLFVLTILSISAVASAKMIILLARKVSSKHELISRCNS